MLQKSNPSTCSQFHHSSAFLKLKKPSLLSSVQTRKLRPQKPRSSPLVFAAQSSIVKIPQIVWNVGMDRIEAGTNLVPATMGFAYSMFIALNKDNGPKGDGGSNSTPTFMEDSLEEARRIMDKYK